MPNFPERQKLYPDWGPSRMAPIWEMDMAVKRFAIGLGDAARTANSGAGRPKLRDAMKAYASWLTALTLARRLGVVDLFDSETKLYQITNHVREWIGEDLLSREL